MILGIKTELTCLQYRFCVNPWRLTQTRIDLDRIVILRTIERVYNIIAIFLDMNKFTKEVNDASLRLNPTIVSRVNKVINQETWTNPSLWVCNEPKRSMRWMNLTLMCWYLGLPSWIRLQWGEPSPPIFHSLVFSNFELCDFLIYPSILNLWCSFFCIGLWT